MTVSTSELNHPAHVLTATVSVTVNSKLPTTQVLVLPAGLKTDVMIRQSQALLV
jgi:hypothetical protein